MHQSDIKVALIKTGITRWRRADQGFSVANSPAQSDTKFGVLIEYSSGCCIDESSVESEQLLDFVVSVGLRVYVADKTGAAGDKIF